MFRILKGQQGQGLVEYLVIVAIMAVATIGIVSALNQTVKAKFTSITYALRGDKEAAESVHLDRLHKGLSSSKDMGNFFDNSNSKGNGNAGE